MKKKLFLFALLVTTYLVHACELHFFNNSNQEVELVSKDGKYMARLEPGQARLFGNPEERAHFDLLIDGQSYEVKQIACSSSHRIFVTTDQVLSQKMDSSLFYTGLTEEVPCGCGIKKSYCMRYAS